MIEIPAHVKVSECADEFDDWIRIGNHVADRAADLAFWHRRSVAVEQDIQCVYRTGGPTPPIPRRGRLTRNTTPHILLGMCVCLLSLSSG